MFVRWSVDYDCYHTLAFRIKEAAVKCIYNYDIKGAVKRCYTLSFFNAKYCTELFELLVEIGIEYDNTCHTSIMIFSQNFMLSIKTKNINIMKIYLKQIKTEFSTAILKKFIRNFALDILPHISDYFDDSILTKKIIKRVFDPVIYMVIILKRLKIKIPRLLLQYFTRFLI